jgi:hypothetical protein
MGFWESDGQTRSEALQIAVEIGILLLIPHLAAGHNGYGTGEGLRRN